jgi:uncharacterized protein YbaR (Trm112 family)
VGWLPRHMTTARNPSGKISHMIAKELLEILVCPACHGELALRESPESLKCQQCHRVYPVRDNIPIMLLDEAVIEAT